MKRLFSSLPASSLVELGSSGHVARGWNRAGHIGWLRPLYVQRQVHVGLDAGVERNPAPFRRDLNEPHQRRKAWRESRGGLLRSLSLGSLIGVRGHFSNGGGIQKSTLTPIRSR